MHLGNSTSKTRKLAARCHNVSFLSGFPVGADYFEKYSKIIRYFEHTLFGSLFELVEYSCTTTNDCYGGRYAVFAIRFCDNVKVLHTYFRVTVQLISYTPFHT